MAQFTGMVLTNKGRDLQAKAEAGHALSFTKVKIGDGQLAQGQSLENLNDLVAPIQILDISSVQAEGNGLCRIRATVTNAGITQGFYVREIGLFATDPDVGEILYAISTASAADYLPPEGGATVVNNQFDILVVVGNASQITATISPSGLVSVDDLRADNIPISDAANNFISDDVEGALAELFTFGVDGKEGCVTRINAKGGSVLGTSPHSFQEIWDGIDSIQRGSGDAQPADVLATKTFSNDSGPGQVGTMPDNGSWGATPGAAAVTIPRGFHDGTGQVEAVTFDASKVLSDTTIAGTTGMMPERGANTWTPTTVDQLVPEGHYAASTVEGDPNLIAANILSGKSIFGVAGSVIAGKRFASGTTQGNGTGAGYSVTVRGLAFQPSMVILEVTDPSYGPTGATFRTSYWSDTTFTALNSLAEHYPTTGTSYGATLTNVVPTMYPDGFTVGGYGGSSGNLMATWIAIE